MVASIDQMKGLISTRGGVARSNLFNVILPSDFGLDGPELNILCRDVQLPGRQILTRERQLGLQRRKIAYGFAQEDVSMTFQLLNDYGAKRYFENWKNTVVDQDTFEIGYHADYVRDVTIQQLDKNSRVVYTCRLLEAFPTTLTTIQLNNEQDSLLEVNVQLSYTNWESR
jgi:hypothetical protein